MKLRTLRFALGFVAIFFSVFIIVTDVCILGQRECLSAGFTIKSSMLNSLQKISFQALAEYLPDNKQIDVRRLPRGLNHHVWEKNCIQKIEKLCSFPIFPKAPDQRGVVHRTEITEPKDSETDGHRLFGFLIPSTTGEHHFAVASNGMAEVWLSENDNWRTAKQIAFIRPLHLKSELSPWDFNISKTQISTGMYLKSRVRYYFEILYALDTQTKVENFLQVAWKQPHHINYDVIAGQSLSWYKNDSEMAAHRVFDDDLPNAKSCIKKIEQGYHNKHMELDASLPFLRHTAVSKALAMCPYRPSYVLARSDLKGFQRSDGVKKHVQKTFTYPFTIVDGIVRLKRSFTFYYEYPLDEEEAWSIVNTYMDALETNYLGRYVLVSIRKVEKKDDHNKGVRYFIEVVVSDKITDEQYILADYVYKPNGDKTPLCYPEGLQWDTVADVYLILTAKNLGRWVHNFIKNVEKIVEETKDEHLHVVIYDFDSPDIDLKQALQKSTLTKYHFIRKPGKYSRTISFTEAIDSIKNPNAIVVTIDLHLDLASQFINDIRKHCIKGKSIYAPDIVFLNCGGSSSKPMGSWYHYSYGTIAMYKEDWKNFGGFSASFSTKTTWGAEDWDLIDRAVRGGLEIERKRSPWVYHYHHSKVGMWNGMKPTEGTS